MKRCIKDNWKLSCNSLFIYIYTVYISSSTTCCDLINNLRLRIYYRAPSVTWLINIHWMWTKCILGLAETKNMLYVVQIFKDWAFCGGNARRILSHAGCVLFLQCFFVRHKKYINSRDADMSLFNLLGPKWVICVMSVSDEFLKLGIGGGLIWMLLHTNNISVNAVCL